MFLRRLVLIEIKKRSLIATKKQNNIISSYDTSSTDNIKEIKTENVQGYVRQVGSTFKFDTPYLFDSQIVCSEDDIQKIEFIVFVSKEFMIPNSSDRKSKEIKNYHIEPTLINYRQNEFQQKYKEISNKEELIKEQKDTYEKLYRDEIDRSLTESADLIKQVIDQPHNRKFDESEEHFFINNYS